MQKFMSCMEVYQAAPFLHTEPSCRVSKLQAACTLLALVFRPVLAHLHISFKSLFLFGYSHCTCMIKRF